MKAVLLRAQRDSKRFQSGWAESNHSIHRGLPALALMSTISLLLAIIAGSFQQRAVGPLSKLSQMMIFVNLINIVFSAFGGSKLALGALLQCLAKLASSLGGKKNSRGDRRKRLRQRLSR